MAIALIDMDELLFKVAVGYISKRYYTYSSLGIISYHYSRQDAIESICNDVDIELGCDEVVLPFTNLEQKIDFRISKILANSKCSDYLLCVSGKNNFRYSLATLLPYKGNRIAPKPSTLNDILVFFKENYQYKEVEGLEADDLLAHYSTVYKDSVICSTDKDLRTVPSMNYNIDSEVLQKIIPSEARYNFWYQMLVGDMTDNIPSPYLLGDKTARRILDEIKHEDTDEAYYSHILPVYSHFLTTLKKKGRVQESTEDTGSESIKEEYRTEWYSGQKVEDVLLEVGNLIYMHRTLDLSERYSLPNMKE